MRGKDITGQRFGRFVVLRVVGRSRQGNLLWECQCDCGSAPWIVSSGNVGRRVLSCGCLRSELQSAFMKENAASWRTTHGAKSRTHSIPQSYRSWQSMRRRCLDAKDKSWPYYGGRGITVCARWTSYEAFLSDMGETERGMEIERLNSDGNYEPGNCVWATRTQQNRNTRRNARITLCGEQTTVLAACEQYGVKPHQIHHRVWRTGETHTEAFLTMLGNKMWGEPRYAAA